MQAASITTENRQSYTITVTSQWHMGIMRIAMEFPASNTHKSHAKMRIKSCTSPQTYHKSQHDTESHAALPSARDSASLAAPQHWQQ